MPQLRIKKNSPSNKIICKLNNDLNGMKKILPSIKIMCKLNNQIIDMTMKSRYKMLLYCFTTWPDFQKYVINNYDCNTKLNLQKFFIKICHDQNSFDKLLLNVHLSN